MEEPMKPSTSEGSRPATSKTVDESSTENAKDLPSHHELWPCFYIYFPLLSSNEHFRSICDYIINLYIEFKESQIYPLLLMMWSAFLFVMRPFRVISKVYYRVVIVPCFKIFVYFLKLVAIYKTTVKVLEISLDKLDYVLSVFFTFFGAFIKFIAEKKDSILKDLRKFIQQMSTDLEKVVKTVVITTKKLFVYGKEFYKLVFPTNFQEFVRSFIQIFLKICRAIYHFIMSILEGITKFIKLVIKTWNDANIDPTPVKTKKLTRARENDGDASYEGIEASPGISSTPSEHQRRRPIEKASI